MTKIKTIETGNRFLYSIVVLQNDISLKSSILIKIFMELNHYKNTISLLRLCTFLKKDAQKLLKKEPYQFFQKIDIIRV
jgi:tRNA G26 N,N-dimethylase Trm1